MVSVGTAVEQIVCDGQNSVERQRKYLTASYFDNIGSESSHKYSKTTYIARIGRIFVKKKNEISKKRIANCLHIHN